MHRRVALAALLAVLFFVAVYWRRRTMRRPPREGVWGGRIRAPVLGHDARRRRAGKWYKPKCKKEWFPVGLYRFLSVRCRLVVNFGRYTRQDV